MILCWHKWIPIEDDTKIFKFDKNNYGKATLTTIKRLYHCRKCRLMKIKTYYEVFDYETKLKDKVL